MTTSQNLIAINGNIIGGLPIASENLKLLWENPDPTASFTSQTITLSSDNYDFLLVTAVCSTTNGAEASPLILKKNSKGILNYATATSPAAASNRTITCTSDSQLSVDSAWNAGSVVNTELVPIAVYGIYKKSIANTDASKCIMSDGVTSVEDKLNDIDRGSITVTGDGSKTYSQVLDSLFALVDPTKLTSKSVLQVSISATTIMNLALTVADSSSYIFTRTVVDGSSSTTYIDSFSMMSSGSTWYRSTITTTAAYSNRSSNTVGSGMPITLYY